jgi:hypothetical protein
MQSLKIVKVKNYCNAEVSRTQPVPLIFSETVSINGADIDCVSDVVFIKINVVQGAIDRKIGQGQRMLQ